MFILCDDIMEMIGKEVQWDRNKEKWNEFWRLVCININPIHYQAIRIVDSKEGWLAYNNMWKKHVLEILLQEWKLLIFEKYKKPYARWNHLCCV